VPLRLVLLAAILIPASAQQAALQGIVTDSTGAAIPKASVSALHSATGVQQATSTNEQGFYSIPFLVPGKYTVKAASRGFATQSMPDLDLDIGATVRADFSLDVSKVEVTVEVKADAALLNTETTTVGQVISNEQVVELPLNDRNYLELAMLTPGAVPSDGARNADAGAFSAAGSRSNQVNVTLDGIDNASRLSGGQLGWEAQAVTPSVDAVQEFRVVTNNNSAEFGFRMGGTVMVQTKSGTNAFHGSLYEFLRNDKLAAANFFVNRAGEHTPPYKRNQYGATLGGRLVRDRTFFFASYEGRKIHVGEENTPSVPIAAYKKGDFSRLTNVLYDPATTRQVSGRWQRDPFAANQIPVSRFDPVGGKVAQWYPDPTMPGLTRNYFYSPVNVQDTDQFDGRFDHNFSGAQRFFFRYSRRNASGVDPGPLPLPADGGMWTYTTVLATSYVGNLNSLISSTTNNELRFGFTRSDSMVDIPFGQTPGELGIKGLPDLAESNDHGVTRFAVTNYTDLGSRSFWPNPNVQNVTHISDQLSRIAGRHLMKAGAETRIEKLTRHSARYSRGVMTFNASFTQDPNNRGRTGESYADLLLGLATSSTISNFQGEDMRIRNYALFLQDDWKLSPRITLNLGARWDRIGAPSFGSLKELPVGVFQLGPPGSSEYTIQRPKDESDCGCRHDNNNLAPRVGLAVQARRSLVARAGFGVYYGTADSYQEAAYWHNGAPDYAEVGLTSDRLVQPAVTASVGFPKIFPVTTMPANLSIFVGNPFRPTQYAMHWFLDLQQQLPQRVVLTVSYLGNGSRQMVWNRDLNASPGVGSASLKSRQAWQFFNAVQSRQAGGNASYNGLAAKAEKRYHRGMMFLVSYSWSHFLDDGAGQLGDGVGTWRDPYRISLDHSSANYDRRHTLVSTFIYDLPFGRRGRWGRQWSRVLDGALGGWQFSGIGTLRSGRPYSVTVSGNPANSDGTNYANRLGEGSLAADSRSIDRWFDLAAFAVPAQYTVGNGGRNILIGPDTRKLDLKLGKNFRVRERYRVEFRGEMFNFTNTPSFAVPNAVLNNVNAGTIASASPPRVVQVALKIVY
jgi:hypothetical protein